MMTDIIIDYILIALYIYLTWNFIILPLFESYKTSREKFHPKLLKEKFELKYKPENMTIAGLIIVNEEWLKLLKYKLTENSLILTVPEIYISGIYYFKSRLYEFPINQVTIKGEKRVMLEKHLIFFIKLDNSASLEILISKKSLKKNFPHTIKIWTDNAQEGNLLRY